MLNICLLNVRGKKKRINEPKFLRRVRKKSNGQTGFYKALLRNRVTYIALKSGMNSGAPGRISTSCPKNGTRRVTLLLCI